MSRFEMGLFVGYFGFVVILKSHIQALVTCQKFHAFGLQHLMLLSISG